MKILVVTLLLSVSLASALAYRTLQVIVVHPKPDVCSTETSQGLSQCSEVLSVEEDILSAANRTANEINSCSELLDGFTVQVESVSSHFPCSVVDLARVLRSPSVNTTVVGMVGLVGQSLARNILPLPSDLRIIQIIQPALGLRLDHTKHYPHLYTAAPSMDQHIAAVIEMLPALNWTRIGLVYSSEGSVFARAAERFVTLNNCSDKPITVREFSFSERTLEEVQTYQQINVFVLLLSPRNLSQFLCAVHSQGLVWPNYGWIVLNDRRSVEFEIDTLQCNSSASLIKNTIIGTLSTQHSKEWTPGCQRSNDGNTYESMLNHIIWTLAMALNSSTSPTVIIDYNTISSIQDYLEKTSLANTVQESVINITFGLERTIGCFNYAMRELNIDLNSLGPVPTVSPSQVQDYEVFSSLAKGLLVTVAVLSIIFTTATLALFIYYRKLPEVKASSVPLSLCTFVGLYVGQITSLSHIIYSGTIVTSTPERYSSCMVPAYTAPVAIDIVLATLLMRLLRVWKIFTVFGRTGKLWTDQVLLAVVGVIVFIKVVILIAWTVADPFFLTDIVTISPSGTTQMIVQQCVSNNTTLWFTLTYGYSGILGICLLVAAIKTRKIQRDNFKDTKKVCGFTIFFLYSMVVTGGLWRVHRSIGSISSSNLTLAFCYCFFIFQSVGFLFVPKVLPPLKRKIKEKLRVLFGTGHQSVCPQQ